MPDDPLAPPDNPLAPVHRPETKPADYLNELLQNPEILRRTIEQAGNFAFGAGATRPFEGRVPPMGGPGSLSGLSRAMQVPSRFVDPEARRLQILEKLWANEDFNPILRGNKMHFPSLDAAENAEMNRIGWSRAPHVTQEMETSPETARDAWQQNILFWLRLANPYEE